MTGGVPERPLLAPWYRVVGDGERLLLEHGQSVVVLEGAAVGTLLPVLLPLLDGTRTVDELVSTIGMDTSPAVGLALETLARHGLLAEGPDAPLRVRATAESFAAAYDLPPSVGAERLRRGVVGVVGGSPTGKVVARLLLAAGVGEVRPVSWQGDGDKVDLAVAAPTPQELALLGPWNRVALAAARPWLGVQPFDGRLATVGPLFLPGESCCHECVQLRRTANLEYGAELAAIESVPLVASADPAFESLVGAIAAHVALRWIVGHDPALPGVLHAVEPQPALTLTEHTVLRVPRCPACSSVERLAPPLPWHAAEAA